MENFMNAAKTIDSVSVPEEYNQDGDPMLPRYGVTVFFQSKEEAQAFADAAQTLT